MKDILDGAGSLDELLRFYPLRNLEVLQRSQKLEAGENIRLSDYAHLRDRPIDLEEIPLTDKQLMAVSLVFYGGVKKKRAADAMKISSQTLDDHIQAALKKIETSLMT